MDIEDNEDIEDIEEDIKNIKDLKQEKKNHRHRLMLSLLKIVILLTIVVGIPLYIILFQPTLLTAVRNFDDVVDYLQRYEKQSILIYIGLQILQVVISVIPGQVFQLAAGYLYGFWPALFFAMVGAVIGTSIAFLLAKVLGRDFLHLIFSEEKLSYYITRLNSKRAYTIVFLLYLIPGLPKDMVSYAAGVSEMKFKPFLLLSAVGRLPGMIGCLLMGMFLESGNYTGMIIVAVIAVLAFLLCIIYRKRINQHLDKIYEKITK